jgi:HEAT repeat protein
MQCIDELLKQLTEADLPGRIQALEELAAHPDDTRVIPALRTALADPADTAVTKAATDALLAIGTPEAAHALLESLLNDEEEAADHLAFFLYSAGERGSPLADEVLRRYREA